jgi:hypothetical protein
LQSSHYRDYPSTHARIQEAPAAAPLAHLTDQENARRNERLCRGHSSEHRLELWIGGIELDDQLQGRHSTILFGHSALSSTFMTARFSAETPQSKSL